MILYLNANDRDVTWNKKQYLLEAAKRTGLPVEPLKTGVEPEYVLNIEPFDFVKGTKWTGIWEIDLLADRQETGKYWHDVDVTFVAGSLWADRIQGNPRLLLQACDPTFYYPEIKQEYDYVTTGSFHNPQYTKRIAAYDELKKHFTSFDFGKDKSPQEYVKSISTARIQFIRSMATPIGDGEIAQRFFECLAIGPVLTNYVEDLKHTGLIEGEDYFFYKDHFEMLIKFRYLLDNPEFALKMARNGRTKALAYHTYDHRLITIFQYIWQTIQ